MSDGNDPLPESEPASSVDPEHNQDALDQEIPDPSHPLRPEDFYMEGSYLVFTAAYHLRRGYCCNSDCRHCPYK